MYVYVQWCIVKWIDKDYCGFDCMLWQKNDVSHLILTYFGAKSEWFSVNNINAGPARYFSFSVNLHSSSAVFINLLQIIKFV